MKKMTFAVLALLTTLSITTMTSVTYAGETCGCGASCPQDNTGGDAGSTSDDPTDGN